jgi:hypothetical protein
MTTEQKIIRTEAGVLDSAKQLGNVRQAYQVMGLPPGQLLPVQGAVLKNRISPELETLLVAIAIDH